MSTTSKLFDLTGCVAVVAGGAGYLGSEICRELAGHGAEVIVADINLDAATRLADDLPGGRAVMLDASKEESIHALLQSAARVDIFVDLTIARNEKPLDQISGQQFTQALHGNLTSSFVLTREARRFMSNGSSVILFSSMYGRVVPDPRVYQAPMQPNPIEYGVAKAGLEQMIRYLAVTWAPAGIRVNGIAPGPFPSVKVQEAHPEFVGRLAQRVPLGRVGKQNEVAGAAVFLASAGSSFVTGHILVVDGGWTIW